MNTTNTTPTNPMISNEWICGLYQSGTGLERACPGCPPTFRIETQLHHLSSLPGDTTSLSLVVLQPPDSHSEYTYLLSIIYNLSLIQILSPGSVSSRMLGQTSFQLPGGEMKLAPRLTRTTLETSGRRNSKHQS